jgi:hypothetical protein
MPADFKKAIGTAIIQDSEHDAVVRVSADGSTVSNISPAIPARHIKHRRRYIYCRKI